jgi:hypothetical protein
MKKLNLEWKTYSSLNIDQKIIEQYSDIYGITIIWLKGHDSDKKVKVILIEEGDLSLNLRFNKSPNWSLSKYLQFDLSVTFAVIDNRMDLKPLKKCLVHLYEPAENEKEDNCADLMCNLPTFL